MNWNPYEKPLLHVCPKEFCFFWSEAGNSQAPGLFESINNALQHAKPISETGCGCTFGVCIRYEAEKGSKDWYEPCEPTLEQMGLPWFYFCNPQKLKDKDKRKYDKYFENI